MSTHESAGKELMVLSGAVASSPLFLETARELAWACLDKDALNVVLDTTPLRQHEEFESLERFIDIGAEHLGGTPVPLIAAPGALPSHEQAVNALGAADIWWISGGNPRHALDQLETLGIKDEFCRRVGSGTLVAVGASAPGVEMSRRGFSDYPRNGVDVDYTMLSGLGLLNCVTNVHQNGYPAPEGNIRDRAGRTRSEAFEQALATEAGWDFAIGLDCAAGISVQGTDITVLPRLLDGKLPAVLIDQFKDDAVHVYDAGSWQASQSALPKPRRLEAGDKFTIARTV